MYVAIGRLDDKSFWCGYGFTKKSAERQALKHISFCTDSYIHLFFQESDRLPELPFIFDVRAVKAGRLCS